jgi:sugar-phosphatase
MTEITASGLLFDCDGVLADSLQAAALAWDAWAVDYAPTYNFRRDFVHGRRMDDVVDELVSSTIRVEAGNALVRREVETAVQSLTIPGAIALVESLPAGSWAVVTSGLRVVAEARLAAAGLPTPAHMVTSEDVTLGKPNPEPYLAGAALLGLDPAECVVFEDAPAGIRAGLDAGAKAVIGIGSSALNAGAHVVVADHRAVSYRHGVLVIDDSMRLDL